MPVRSRCPARSACCTPADAEKGIYTLLAALHSNLFVVGDERLSFTVTLAGADRPQGRIIRRLLDAHPGVSVVAAGARPPPWPRWWLTPPSW